MKPIYYKVTYPDGEVEYWTSVEEEEVQRLEEINNGTNSRSNSIRSSETSNMNLNDEPNQTPHHTPKAVARCPQKPFQVVRIALE